MCENATVSEETARRFVEEEYDVETSNSALSGKFFIDVDEPFEVDVRELGFDLWGAGWVPLFGDRAFISVYRTDRLNRLSDTEIENRETVVRTR